MVYRIIWADRVALRGAEAATGCEELVIVNTKKMQKKNTNRQKPNIAKPLKRISLY